MAFSSINNTLSLHLQPVQQLTLKHRNHAFYKTQKPQFPHHSISPNSITKISFSIFSPPPISITSNTTTKFSLSVPISPQENPHKIFCQKLTVLVVGSLVLMQCLCQKKVFAQPVESGVTSEKVETQQNERVEKEEEMYMKILEGNPKNVDALKVLVYGCMRKGKTKKAVENVEKLIDIEPNEVEWRLLQAICYEMMGQLSKAKRLFLEILEERPLLVKALHGLAMIMHKNHEGPAMFEMLHKALEVAIREKRVTEERNIKILIAQMHVVKGELETGLKILQDLVEENPRDFRPYLCQGIVYSLLEKKEEAEEQFKTYRSLVPEEFPQRGFLDDVVLTANLKSRQPPKKKR